MFARSVVLAAGCLALMAGCAGSPEETEETGEIVSNLLQAGFPADDIRVTDGKVYVGRDAHVTLAASREMLERGDTSQEQYRTNRIASTLSKICINGPAFTGVFSTGLDLAIQNYDDLPLEFAMARAPSSGCSFTINAVLNPGSTSGQSGFPSNGLPYGTIIIGDQIAQYGVDVLEHVITHEIGHALGFRHTDFYNRSISCGAGGNEGTGDVGAIHIPGTPTTATFGDSLMNSCYSPSSTGEFSAADITALMAMYSGPYARLEVNWLYTSPDPDYVYEEVEYSVSFWADRNHTIPVTLSQPTTLDFEYSENEIWPSNHSVYSRRDVAVSLPAGSHSYVVESSLVARQCRYDYGNQYGLCYERGIWLYDGLGYSVAR